MPDALRHESIAASAGSGKTYQLSLRYIRLMAQGVAPEKINALTFSRKAAGEIFDSIVKQLREAAESEEKAAETSSAIEQPGFKSTDYLQLLRKLMDHMHRLNTGTLDSFTIKVVQAFPMELGIGLDFQIMDNDGSEAAAEQQRVLQRIFRPGGINQKIRNQFFQAFKQATYGQEEKTLTDILLGFIRNQRDLYLQCDQAEYWGKADQIWPETPAWLDATDFAPEQSESVITAIQEAAIPANAAKDFIAFIEFARDYEPRKEWPDKLFKHVAMKRLFVDLDALARGPVSLQHGKKDYLVPADIGGYLHAMAMHVLRANYLTCLNQTQGIYQVLKLYEQFYDRLVRRRGRLTFDDAQYLLTPNNRHSKTNQLTSEKDAENRLYIDFRLNARFDHWLLDEFQDTSDAQWAAFQNLIDEIVQDPEGNRSFFYVGDVKQAIYRWRGGNTRLFNEIRQRYEGQIEHRDMSVSWRSCPAVLAMVNAVFQNIGDAEKLPAEAVERWNEIYRKHEPQPDLKSQKGYCAFVKPLDTSGRDKISATDRYELVAGILKEIKPLERGLSVAILTRTNKQGEAIARHLREDEMTRKMRIVREGASPILDDPLAVLMINLVRFASHPGNTLARRHIEMSPLMQVLAAREWSLDTLALQVLDTIHQHGFRETLRAWIDELQTVQALNDFAEKRAGELLQAAAEYDSRMSRNPDGFIRFIESYTLREMAASSAVRIMTLHQSKGLGFDVVILPELLNDSMRHARLEQMTASYGKDGRSIDWILKMPREFIVENDEVLRAERDRQDAEHCFDQLCELYVSMTRAKRCMYLITGTPGRDQTNHSRFIKSRLHLEREIDHDVDLPGRQMVVQWEAGNVGWYADCKATPSPVIEPSAAELKELSQTSSKRVRLSRRRPSDVDHAANKAASLFEYDNRERADYGTAIHGLFEEITWLNETPIKDAIRAWKPKFSMPEENQQVLVNEFMTVLDDLECRALLSSREIPCEVWREQEFEIVIDGQWITGVIDRAVIAEDKSFAEIIDFKSNRMPIEDAAATQSALEAARRSYQNQLHLYRRAMSMMLDIPEERILLKLLFTHPARIISVD